MICIVNHSPVIAVRDHLTYICEKQCLEIPESVIATRRRTQIDVIVCLHLLDLMWCDIVCTKKTSVHIIYFILEFYILIFVSNFMIYPLLMKYHRFLYDALLQMPSWSYSIIIRAISMYSHSISHMTQFDIAILSKWCWRIVIHTLNEK